MTRYFAPLVLAAALTATVTVNAQDKPVRYYDKSHKDYHEWNDNENTHYQTYLTEKHLPAHDFAKAKKSEQESYWKWRHEHGDTH